jgi:hypothetical protein
VISYNCISPGMTTTVVDNNVSNRVIHCDISIEHGNNFYPRDNSKKYHTHPH